MLQTKKINDVIVVSFNNTDRLNALIAEPVKEELKSLFSNSGTKLLLNLDGISFIDSSGFAVFLSILKQSGNTGGQFKICNVSDEAMELFKLLQLHNIFEIYNSEEEGINSF